MPDVIDDVRKNHEFWHSFYKAMGSEELFFHKFWDGYDNFDDFFLYGDMFPSIDIDRMKKSSDAEHLEIRNDAIESYKNGFGTL